MFATERYEDHIEALRSMHDARQALIWTSLPGVIQSFDASKMTVQVQPTIQALLTFPDLTQQWVTLPLLSDCPVIFPSGGGVTFTFPIKNGDECLIIFSSRCIDNWWAQGGIQNQYELRMHDLSDGFVLPGPRSQPRLLSGVSTTAAEIRSDDGKLKVSIDPQKNAITATAGSASVTLDGAGNALSLKATTINLN